MPTQTGSIDFKSTKGFQSYASGQYTTKTEFNSLEIGGRNLLPYSTPSADNIAKVSTANSYNTFVNEDGYLCYKITNGATNGAQYASNAKFIVKLEADTQYTYSAWVKLTTTASVTSVALNFGSLGHFTVKNDNSSASDKTHEDVASLRIYSPTTVPIGEWTRIKLTFTTNSLDGSYFGVYPKYNLGTEYTLFIRDEKLEKGNKATDWSPAPKDTTERIVKAETAIEQTANNVLIKATQSDTTAAQGGQHLIESLINVAPSGVKIAASKVEIDGAAVFSNSAFQQQLTSSYSKTVEYTYNNSGQGTGYAKLCNIAAHAAYLNLPISFTLLRRGQATTTHVTIAFTNGSPTDTISKAYFDGWLSLYYVRVGTGSYDIYFALGESYDNVKVVDFVNPYTSANMTVTWGGAYYGTSLPEGAVEFTRLIGNETKELYDTKISTAQSTANTAQETANNAAPKASAVKRTQRIWYRKEVAGAPATPSSWVVKADDGSNAWTKMHVSITETEKFIYTCEQYEMANGTIGYTSVLLDNTITVIDGGSIITDSVTANQIAAGTITGNEIAGGTITSDNIEAGAISADRLDANALTVGNIAGLEDKLETITNGISSLSNSTQWVHFQDDVGTVFGEAGSANNVTVKADGVYFNTEGGEAARASAGIFYSNEMRANDSISTPILKMGNWALVQSGTTFSIEYLG